MTDIGNRYGVTKLNFQAIQPKIFFNYFIKLRKRFLRCAWEDLVYLQINLMISTT